MAVVDLRLDPTARELRWFALLVAAFFGVAGTLARWGFDAPGVSTALWTAGGLLALVYQAVPPWRRSIYRGWVLATYPLGWLVSHVVLAAVYYLVITPIGLALRLTGHDPLGRRFQRDADTYWTPRPRRADTERYFRQY